MHYTISPSPYSSPIQGEETFLDCHALAPSLRSGFQLTAMIVKKRACNNPSCHCEECEIPRFTRNRLRNLIALTSLRSTLSFCSATLQGRAHEAKASHYISELCSVILPFDFWVLLSWDCRASLAMTIEKGAMTQRNTAIPTVCGQEHKSLPQPERQARHSQCRLCRLWA